MNTGSELTHSGRTVAEVEWQEESIRRRLENEGFTRDQAIFEELVCLIFSREILVAKMGTTRPGERLWDELSREIVGIECHLAPHGLV